jgi:uncharacterized membrane protein YgdD (TMEM256/DUF423 family)
MVNSSCKCTTTLFSGSLYVLSLTGLWWQGAITLLGGLAFLAGQVCLARQADVAMESTTS